MQCMKSQSTLTCFVIMSPIEQTSATPSRSQSHAEAKSRLKGKKNIQEKNKELAGS